MFVKIIVFTLVIAVSVALPRYITMIGNVFKKAGTKHNYIGSALAVPHEYPLNRVIVKFPQYPEQEGYIIRGIESVDFALKPSEIKILRGGVNSKSVTIAVTSQKGVCMGSTIHFYGEKATETNTAPDTNANIWTQIIANVEELKLKAFNIESGLKALEIPKLETNLEATEIPKLETKQQSSVMKETELEMEDSLSSSLLAA